MFFSWVFFVYRIVLFCDFFRAPNRIFFWFFSCTKSLFFFELFSCTKSCFFVVFVVHQIVFFCGFLRAPNGALIYVFFLMILFYIPNRALVRIFLLFSSCTNWYTKKTAKKHDLVHEENQKKARFGARRKVKKSTVWCTKKTAKKHDLVHEENQHDLVHEKNQKKARYGALLRTTVTEVRQDTIFKFRIFEFLKLLTIQNIL